MYTFTQWAEHYGYDTTTNEGMTQASRDYAEYVNTARLFASIT